MHSVIKSWSSKARAAFATLGLLGLLLVFTAPGCRDDGPLGPPSDQQPVWHLVAHTDCKTQANILAGGTVPSDMDCIEYHYGATGTLTIKHINAAFNCCPGDISIGVSMTDGTVTIVEREAQSPCDCSCLYDLEYEIRNLDPRHCRLMIIEPYLDGDDEPLTFPIDLVSRTDGFVCRFRDHYPWMYQSTMTQDSAALDTMRAEIVDFIGSPSCGGSAECRSIPFGVKPCGGPWAYLIYSSATISAGALDFRVSRYNAFNDAFNHRYNVASDCRYVLPPALRCVDGVCACMSQCR